jgi:hypothetical protein
MSDAVWQELRKSERSQLAEAGALTSSEFRTLDRSTNDANESRTHHPDQGRPGNDGLSRLRRPYNDVAGEHGNIAADDEPPSSKEIAVPAEEHEGDLGR